MGARTDHDEVVVGGIRTACLSRDQLAALMVEHCLARRVSPARAPRLVFAVNGQTLSAAARDSTIRNLFDSADLVHADGQPVVFASRWLTRVAIPERSATTDFFHDAAMAASKHGLKFFLLGATEEVNARCTEAMRMRYPGLDIVGRRHGYFARGEETEICETINRSGADVVWVGLGMPLEHAFCVRNRSRLQAGWIVTAGGCFNYVSGHYRRAPRWMQKVGLEWLHRVWREPRRLFWRYAVTNPHALYLLLTRTFAVREAAREAGTGVAELGV